MLAVLNFVLCNIHLLMLTCFFLNICANLPLLLEKSCAHEKLVGEERARNGRCSAYCMHNMCSVQHTYFSFVVLVPVLPLFLEKPLDEGKLALHLWCLAGSQAD